MRWFEQRGEKQERAAAFLGLRQGALSGFLTGRDTPSLAAMEVVAVKLEMELIDILVKGKAILAGEAPSPSSARPPLTLIPAPPPLRAVPDDELESDYHKIPFRDDMRVAAGEGEAPEWFYDVDTSPVVIHKAALRLYSARNLVAFRVGGDSMEPTIMKNGIIVVDITQNEWDRLKEKAIYMIRLDDAPAVKRLEWARRDETLAVISDNPLEDTVYREVEEVGLYGRVIWSWGQH